MFKVKPVYLVKSLALSAWEGGTLAAVVLESRRGQMDGYSAGACVPGLSRGRGRMFKLKPVDLVKSLALSVQEDGTPSVVVLESRRGQMNELFDR